MTSYRIYRAAETGAVFFYHTYTPMGFMKRDEDIE